MVQMFRPYRRWKYRIWPLQCAFMPVMGVNFNGFTLVKAKILFKIALRELSK